MPSLLYHRAFLFGMQERPYIQRYPLLLQGCEGLTVYDLRTLFGEGFRFGIRQAAQQAGIFHLSRVGTIHTVHIFPERDTLCIQHISAKESVEYVRQAKQKGADVHAEATPHHFTLTEDAVLKYGTYARMNPPLRTEEDRQAIIEGIVDGTIDMIVTDHAPHSKEEKAQPMDKAPSGITGLETSLGLGIKSLVQPGHISLIKLMELMSTNPAKLYRMIPGSISEDEPADIVIFGENEEWEVKEEEYASKAVNSPFTGWTLPGKVHYTICGGKIVYWGV